jgi:type I restriction enzyme S subunit
MSFPPHSAYSKSGEAWLGELPSHWRLGKFSREISIAEGQVDPEVEPHSSMLLIAPNHVESGTGMLLAVETAHEQGASSGKYMCRKGDVIYSKIRPALAKCVIAPEDCLCSADMYPMRGRGRIRNEFLLWLLLSKEFTGWSVLEADRVAMPKINRETLNDLRLPIPPPDEQRGIAAFLDRETVKIDALVDEQRQLIELLKEKRQAVISHGVTKGLDPAAPLKDSGVEWLGQVPEHWDIARVKHLIISSTSGPRGWSELTSEEGSIFLQSQNIGRRMDVVFEELKRIAAPDDVESRRARLQADDVVVCVTGARTGAVAHVHELREAAYVNQHVCLLRPASDRIAGRYLAYTLSSAKGQEQLKLAMYGLKQGLGLEDVGNQLVCLPPFVEQLRVIEFLDHVLTRHEALIEEVERGIALLQERRTALISAAVTGKIDVRLAAPGAAEAA